MEKLDKLEDLKLFDSGKVSNEISVPIDDAFKIIEGKWKKKSLLNKNLSF